MRMTVRQINDLVDGDIVGERSYFDAGPEDLYGVLRL